VKTFVALLGVLSIAAADAPETLRFITCPIYRDVDNGRKSGCWLADDRDSGRRFDVSAAPSKPDWNHEVLVEGRVSASAANPCGGIVLDPVRTSVLPGSCVRKMLPAEGFTGTKFTLPRRNVAPMSVVRDVPPPPYAARTFHLFFSYDSPFLMYQYDDYLLDRAITWIRAAKPKRIVVTGYAATRPAIVSGVRIAESDRIARERAERVTEALVRLGVDRATITVRIDNDPLPTDDPEADGLGEPSRRRVDIAAQFGF
jgi:hypothetical protein